MTPLNGADSQGTSSPMEIEHAEGYAEAERLLVESLNERQRAVWEAHNALSLAVKNCAKADRKRFGIITAILLLPSKESGSDDCCGSQIIAGNSDAVETCLHQIVDNEPRFLATLLKKLLSAR